MTFDVSHRAVIPAALVCAVLLAIPSVAFAQSRMACPGAGIEASDDPLVAAQHALCWYERDRHHSTECPPRRDGSSLCVEHAAEWCEIASLGADPQIANACFVARVRSGRFGSAREVLPLLTTTWPEVRACMSALQQSLPLEVLSRPSGASVAVSDHDAGVAPTTVSLPQPWWEQRVSVRFGHGASATIVESSGTDLASHFDRRTCAMRQLTITDASATERRDDMLPAGASTHATGRDRPSRDSGGLLSRWWFWTLAGVVVAGGVTAVLVATQSDHASAPIPGDDGVVIMTLGSP